MEVMDEYLCSARMIGAIGFEWLRRIALGQRFSMRRLIRRYAGIDRNPIIMPAGPAVSPMIWWMPYFAGMCMSALWYQDPYTFRVTSAPLPPMDVTTNPAPSRQSSRPADARTRRPESASRASLTPRAAMSSALSASMS